MRFDNLHINERTTEACERVTTYYTEANQARGWYSFAVVCLEREGLEVYKDKEYNKDTRYRENKCRRTDYI